MNAAQYQQLLQRYITHSNEKQILIQKILERVVNLPFPSQVLDVGCGNGLVSNALADVGHDVMAIDLKNSFFQTSKKTIQFQQADIFKFNTDKKFDLIIAAYVFWEIPQEKWHTLMDHLLNLLHRKGQIFIIDSINDTGYDNQYVNFNIVSEKNHQADDVWYSFLNKKYNYEKNIFDTQIKAKDPLEMYAVLEFFFQGQLQSLYKSQKNRFLESFAQKTTKHHIRQETVIHLRHSLDIIKVLPFC